MGSFADDAPLIVIVGQTASGKSALALEIAKRYDGEIICADSRTVYKGMDIGTAKPTAEERAAIPHHLLDIATPDKPITVADFKQLAEEAAASIWARGKLPILVGGTGLYVDAIIFDFSFRAPSDAQSRAELEKMTVEDLQAALLKENIPLPANSKNPRHLIRQLETGGTTPLKQECRKHTLVLGLSVEPEVLLQNIQRRCLAMIEQGLLEEATSLTSRYGRECRSLQTIGYQEWWPYLDNQATYEETVQLIIRHTAQYAKRQKTWFKRHQEIHWICKKEEYVDLITTFLNKDVRLSEHI